MYFKINCYRILKSGGTFKMPVVSERERGKGVGFSRIRRITGVRRVLN